VSGRRPSARATAAREPRVVDAADALWRYVVTREACGLRDADAVMRDLDVPSEVRRRMGPTPTRPR
jgi:hypothetical protein